MHLTVLRTKPHKKPSFLYNNTYTTLYCLISKRSNFLLANSTYRTKENDNPSRNTWPKFCGVHAVQTREMKVVREKVMSCVMCEGEGGDGMHDVHEGEGGDEMHDVHEGEGGDELCDVCEGEGGDELCGVRQKVIMSCVEWGRRWWWAVWSEAEGGDELCGVRQKVVMSCVEWGRRWWWAMWSEAAMWSGCNCEGGCGDVLCGMWQRMWWWTVWSEGEGGDELWGRRLEICFVYVHRVNCSRPSRHTVRTASRTRSSSRPSPTSRRSSATNSVYFSHWHSATVHQKIWKCSCFSTQALGSGKPQNTKGGGGGGGEVWGGGGSGVRGVEKMEMINSLGANSIKGEKTGEK